MVVDSFLGSGTTLIACEQLGRKCYGIEIEPKFVDVCCRRFISLKESADEVTLIREGIRYTWEQALTLYEKEGKA